MTIQTQRPHRQGAFQPSGSGTGRHLFTAQRYLDKPELLGCLVNTTEPLAPPLSLQTRRGTPDGRKTHSTTNCSDVWFLRQRVCVATWCDCKLLHQTCHLSWELLHLSQADHSKHRLQASSSSLFWISCLLLLKGCRLVRSYSHQMRVTAMILFKVYLEKIQTLSNPAVLQEGWLAASLERGIGSKFCEKMSDLSWQTLKWIELLYIIIYYYICKETNLRSSHSARRLSDF